MRRLLRLFCLLLVWLWVSQVLWAHRETSFLPYQPDVSCQALLPLGITREERFSAPRALAPLLPGDLLVTFSTHTLGWRHGHAALVVDNETVLEAAMPGVPSGFASVDSWKTYSTLMVLRVRGSTPQQRSDVVQFARQHLTDIPYGFFSGFGTKKAPPPPLSSVQCAYLPWYAWFSQGVDLDGDGGRLVTVNDLASSPLVEIVQLRGIHLPSKK